LGACPFNVKPLISKISILLRGNMICQGIQYIIPPFDNSDKKLNFSCSGKGEFITPILQNLPDWGDFMAPIRKLAVMV